MSANAETAEAQARTFIHPVTEQPLGFSEHASDIEKIRLICDPRFLPEFNAGIFSALFPESFEIKQKFNPDTTQAVEETMLTHHQKNIRRAILDQDFGYSTPKRANRNDETFLPHLHVAFTPNLSSFVRSFNRLPEVQKLRDAYQTSLDPRGNRFGHTQHLMHWVVLDVLRFSLHQPELFEQKYNADMREMEAKFARWHDGKQVQFSLEPNPAQLDRMVSRFRAEYGSEMEEDTLLYRARIACIGENEARIALVGTGLHDSETPGFCDLFMKAKHSGLLQDNPDGYFSEDDELARVIWNKTHSDTELARFLIAEQLPSDLLATWVRSTAGENDTTLLGLLYKDKRKGLKDDPEKSHLALGQVLDCDQLSGTVTNMEIMCSEFLPGGFDPHISGDRRPQFSFDARLMILYYAMLSHMDKAKLTTALEQLNINPKDIFIAAEEISYGQNTSLEQVSFGDKTEIMPIPVLPGDVKRTYAAIDVMYAGFYVHPSKETVVELFKNMISAWIVNDIDRSLDFVHRTKNETLDVMRLLNPVMVFFEHFDQKHAGILTFDEMKHEKAWKDAKNAERKYFLAKKIRMKSQVPNKKGTMVRDEHNAVHIAMDLLRKHRGMDEINPNSFSQRHDNLDAFYDQKDYIMRIELTKPEWEELRDLINGMRPDLQRKLIAALDEWTAPIVDGDEVIANPLRSILVTPFAKQTSR